MTNNEVHLSATPMVLWARRFLQRNRIRISLVVVGSLIAADMIRGERPHSVIDSFDAWSAIGVLFVFIGNIIRTWAAGVLHKNAALSTKGPYAISRNPLYLVLCQTCELG